MIALANGSAGHDDSCDRICEGCDGSGIRWPATPSCVLPATDDGWFVVERCDTCQKYEDDLAAAEALFQDAHWTNCADGGAHAVGKWQIDSN